MEEHCNLAAHSARVFIGIELVAHWCCNYAGDPVSITGAGRRLARTRFYVLLSTLFGHRAYTAGNGDLGDTGDDRYSWACGAGDCRACPDGIARAVYGQIGNLPDHTLPDGFLRVQLVQLLLEILLVLGAQARDRAACRNVT